jgi:hypothetical protein
VKKALSLVVLSIFQIAITAQLNLNKGTVTPKKYHQQVEAEFVNGKLIMPVTIEGEKLKFILDTGAPLCISEQFQQQKNYLILTTDSIIDANGKGHLTRIVSVDKIKIGNLLYQNVPALVIDFRGTPLECLQIKGLVGSNLLRFGALQIDWKKKMVTITNSYKKLGLNKKNGTRLLINKVQSSPYLSINVDAGITDRLLIDTGSDDFYTFSKKGLEYVQSKGYMLDAVKYVSEGSNSIGLFGSDTTSSNKLIKVDSLTMGTMAHLHKFYAATTNDDQSRIGVHLLKQGITSIDFKNSLFFFDLYENNFNYEYVSFGFDVNVDQKKLVIGSVWKGSEASKKGIGVGDEIIDIEGLDLKKLNPCEVLLRFKRFVELKKSITLHMKKTKQTEVHKIELKRLILD